MPNQPPPSSSFPGASARPGPAADQEARVQRVLVAVDASPHSFSALDAAARIAADLGASLHALFVEDETVLRAAQLPFTREVRAFTTGPNELTNRRAERQMERRAEEAQYALENVGEPLGLEYDFQVVRGHVATTLLDAAQDADLVTLGKTSATRSSRRRLGSTAQAVLSRAPAPVLVLRRDLHLRQPILTYFDGSAASERALRLAVQLSEAALDSPVKVLLPAGPEQDVQQLRDAVLGRYARRIPRLHVRPLSDLEAQRLANVAANEGTGLVILPSGTPALEERPIQHVLYAIDRPTLVVR